jgi:hypothetical protein
MIASSDENFFFDMGGLSFKSDEEPLHEVADFSGCLAVWIALGDTEALREGINMVRSARERHTRDGSHDLERGTWRDG